MLYKTCLPIVLLMTEIYWRNILRHLSRASQNRTKKKKSSNVKNKDKNNYAKTWESQHCMCFHLKTDLRVHKSVKFKRRWICNADWTKVDLFNLNLFKGSTRSQSKKSEGLKNNGWAGCGRGAVEQVVTSEPLKNCQQLVDQTRLKCRWVERNQLNQWQVSCGSRCSR